jgi:uncharacterized protein
MSLRVAVSERLILLAATMGMLTWWHVPTDALGLTSNGLDLTINILAAIFVVLIPDLLGLCAAFHVVRGGGTVETAANPSSLGLLALLLVAATWEELVFRAIPFAIFAHGPVMNSLNGLAGAVLAMIGFAFAHLSRGTRGMVFAMAYGVFFTAVYLASQSLVAVIAAHFAANAFAIFVSGPAIRARQHKFAHGLSVAPAIPEQRTPRTTAGLASQA